MNLDLKIDTEQMCLYLDDGGGAYCLGLNSYLKYFFPLPLQRIAADSENAKMAANTQSKEKVLAYTGKYVSVYETWFFGDKNMDIYEKIQSEYKLINKIAYFNPNWDLFSETTSEYIGHYDLYERKECDE